MSRVVRYAAMGGVMDFTIYIALSLAPLLAERQWQAGPLALGLLPFSWAVAYAATAVWGGRISDRVSRTSLARLGLFVTVLTCLGFSRATATWHFYVGLPFIALGMAFFWPAIQAAIADESTSDTLNRNLGWFNVSWSAGKGLGVLAGGILLEWIGGQGFLIAAGLALILVFVLPRVPMGGGRGEPLTEEKSLPPVRVRRAFLVSALIANFAAFGLGTTVINHYPDWNAELGRSGFDYGLVVGGAFLAQTVAFAALLLWRGWHYRIGPHLLLQALAGVGALFLATRAPVPSLVPAVILMGFGFGIAYHASIYYSLNSDVARGGRAGRHEAILATGNFLIPLGAGAAASTLPGSGIPYIVGAAVVLLSVALQAVLLFRSR